MSIEPLACPYCNALAPGADSASVGQRVHCPRCGEGFTVRKPAPASSPDMQQAPVAGSPAATVALDTEQRPLAGRYNRIVGAAVLGVMAVMAAIGLAYALYTQPDRRAHDISLRPLPPIALEALRWLPPDTTVVAAVRVAELNRTTAGRDLLKHLFRVGKVDVSGDMLERWTGLKAGEIDHVALGVRADDGLVPRTVLVVRTLRPYDAGAVKTALQAEPAVGTAGKALFKCKAQEAGLRPVLWFADAQTLVFGLLEKHVEAVPDRPAPDLDALPAAVRKLMNQRLDAAGPIWVVGYSKDWRKTDAALVVGALPAKDAELLGHVRGFAVQIDPGPPATALASVKCDDDDSAQVLEGRLTQAKPAPDADWKTGREGPWLTLQIRGDPTALVPSMLVPKLPFGNEDHEGPGK